MAWTALELGTPIAIGYLRSDISGSTREYDEAALRRLAARYGYLVRKIVAFGPRVDDPDGRLTHIVEALRPDAVFVPSAAHFNAEAVSIDLVQLTDVITVDDEHIYARWATGVV